MSWSYKREESQQFPQIPEGRYRIAIDSADKAVSKNGNEMLVLKFRVQGQNSQLWHYISFLTDRPEITNRMLTQFFNSFATIEEGDFNTQNWIGKQGACQVKHDQEGRAKLAYFISANKQSELPAFDASELGFTKVAVQEEELPF